MYRGGIARFKVNPVEREEDTRSSRHPRTSHGAGIGWRKEGSEIASDAQMWVKFTLQFIEIYWDTQLCNYVYQLSISRCRESGTKRLIQTNSATNANLSVSRGIIIARVLQRNNLQFLLPVTPIRRRGNSARDRDARRIPPQLIAIVN